MDGASNPDCTQMHRTKPNEINSIKVSPPQMSKTITLSCDKKVKSSIWPPLTTFKPQYHTSGKVRKYFLVLLLHTAYLLHDISEQRL